MSDRLQTTEPQSPGRPPDVTLVTTRSGTSTVFERNISTSPCLKGNSRVRIIVQEQFSTAAHAYNDAIDKAKTDIIVFAHQDVYLPDRWLADLDRALTILDRSDPDWAVLGGWGITRFGLEAGFLYSVGLGILGEPFERPVTVDTLDEYILILRKSSGLRFDPTLPHFHFYGMDICMAARKSKKSCYAISAFAVHNTSYGRLSPEFYECYWHVRKKWKEFLPVKTSCIKVSFWNEDLLLRKFKRILFLALGRNMKVLPRLDDPRLALRFAEGAPGLANCGYSSMDDADMGEFRNK